MAVTIHVNGASNSLVHKGSNCIAKSTLPDVCKTPSPGGPVPIPYPVIVSMSSDLKKGTKTVKVDGKKMAAIKGSEFSRCTGDEPGTAGGVKSSTNMKEAKWILYSFDVKLDGKNACRLSDKMTMNHGNTVCLGGPTQKGVNGAPPPKCAAGCGKPPHKIPVGKKRSKTALDSHEFIKHLEEEWKKQADDVKRHIDLIKSLEKLKKELKSAEKAENISRISDLTAIVKIRMAEFKAKIEKKGNVLRLGAISKEQEVQSYVRGYMIGVAVCRCQAVRVIACSGEATVGFKRACEKMKNYKLVENFKINSAQKVKLNNMKKVKNHAWACAAPKLLEKCGGSGHKIEEFYERWFDPLGLYEKYSHRQFAGPCEKCQELLPLQLCDNEGPCK